MQKALQTAHGDVPEPAIVTRDGTLCIKTSERVGVVGAKGDIWYLEYKPGAVQSKWREGMLVRVFCTEEFSSRVITMEAL